MQDSNMKYKYVEDVNIEDVFGIEKHFNVLLPSDYKDLLPVLNRGKPSKDQFDVLNRPECVVDYFIDLKLVVQISHDIKQPDFIAIASDPFGNYYGYLKENRRISSVYFWNHENDQFTKCSDGFNYFINLLY
uniref:Knr4/Smi1-like domain-containing protein n=1 Tax=Aliivibrio wodanis TaxID=80852 RepID=A0A5Q4Z4X9_9GAMM|nr:hypothetical protein AW0309160_03815 [Aliivibrio wodanis]